MASLGNLVVTIGANTSGFTRQMNSVANMMNSSKLKRGRMSPGAGMVGGMTGGGMTKAVVGANLLTRALATAHGWMTGLVGQATALAAQTESTKLTFEILAGGNKNVGDALFGEMERLAKDTTLTLEDTTSAARQLLVSFSPAQIPHLVEMLGNISSGMDNVSLQEMAFLLQTSVTEGKLLARDMRQFTTRGINLPGALKDVLGVGSIAEVTQAVTDGQVTIDKTMMALEKLSATTYKNMLARQGQTLKGRMTQFQDSMSFALRDIGTMFIDAFNVKAVFETLTGWVRNFQEQLWKIKPVIAEAAQAFWGWVSVLQQVWAAAKEFFTSGPGLAVLITIGILAAKIALVGFLSAVISLGTVLAPIAIIAGGLWLMFSDMFNDLASGAWTWQEILVTVFATAQWAATNWKDILLYAMLQINSKVHAMAGAFGHFFTTELPAYWAYFQTNSTAVFATITDYLLTAFINTGENIRSFFTELWSWIKSGGTKAWEWQKKDLLDGAVNSVPPMAAIPDRVLSAYEQQMQAEMATLGASLGQGRQDAVDFALEQLGENKEPGKPPGLGPAGAYDFAGAGGAGGGGKDKTGLMQGTQEAWTAILGSMSQDPVVQAIQRQTKQQKDDAEKGRKAIADANAGLLGGMGMVVIPEF